METKSTDSRRVLTALRRVTIVDIAREIGMSAATVSNAITGRRPVDPQTRERVQRAAADLGYQPNIRAQNLRTSRADTIAIFSSMPFAVAGGRARLGYLMEIAVSAAERALQNGMALLLVPPVADGTDAVGAYHADGAIVVEPGANDAGVALLHSRGVPTVAIGKPAADAPMPYVDNHHDEAAMLVLDHLAQAGARRIGLVTGRQSRHAHIEAKRVYRKFARTRGQEPVIAEVDEEGGEAGAYAGTRNLLSGTSLDGLFVSVDTFAVGAIRAARDLGLRVPEDLRIATRYDGLNARTHGLTALDLKLDQLGILAADLLAETMAGNRDLRSVAGPMPELIVRRSSGG